MITIFGFIAGTIIGTLGTLEWVGRQIEKNYPDLWKRLS